MRLAAAFVLAFGLATPVFAQSTDLTQVYPVLRPQGVIAPDVLATLPHKAFPGNLIEVWVVDTSGYLTFLDNDALADAGGDLDTVEADALANLRAKAKGATLQPLQGVQALALDATFESSLLLLPEVWQKLDATLGTVVVAVPTRDVVLVADGDVPAQVQVLRQIVAQVHGKYEFPISDDLFRWDGAGWVVLPR